MVWAKGGLREGGGTRPAPGAGNALVQPGTFIHEWGPRAMWAQDKGRAPSLPPKESLWVRVEGARVPGGSRPRERVALVSRRVSPVRKGVSVHR